MKRILLLASILGATAICGSASAIEVYRSIPALDDATAAQQAAPGQPTATEGTFDVGDMGEAEEAEPEKFISGSIVGTWADGFAEESPRWRMDQVWLTSEHEVDSEKPGLDVGYRVDALFGHNILQSSDGFDGKWGVSDDGYGASIYQAYGQLGWGKLSLKAGKFGTTIGYESVDESVDEFTTHTHMFEHEPATHMGGLFSLQATDTLNFDFGMVSGNDNSFANRRGDTGFLFGAGLQLAENVNLSYAGELMQVHNELGENNFTSACDYYDLGGVDIGDADEYLQTVTASIDFTEKFKYTFVSNYGTMSDRATHQARHSQLGFANYFVYELTEQLTAAARYEYYMQWLDKAGRAGANEVKENVHDVSFGLVYRPIESIFIRPEVRYDWVETGDIKNKLTSTEDGVTGAVSCGFTF